MKTNEQYLKEVYEKYSKQKKEIKMPKILKLCATFICIAVATVGVVYAGIAIKNYVDNAKLTPSFSGSIGNVKENKVWVATFQLAWNELMEELGGKIEFEEETPQLAKDLNQKSFTRDMLNKNSYYIEKGLVAKELKQKIEENLKKRFNLESKVLDNVNWNSTKNEYLIYAMLNKTFTFENPFTIFSSYGNNTFAGSDQNVKYFGLQAHTVDETFEQVTALFYNTKEEFAVKIATKEGEEVILYRTNNVIDFDKTYTELEQKTKAYTGKRELIREKDELKIPFIKLNAEINYDELCNKTIKGTNGAYLKQALQMVAFELDNYGGNITSQALINMYMSASMEEPRKFYFTDKFVLFLKEENKQKPYFALLVDNTDVLVTTESPKEMTNVTIDKTI